MKNIFVPSFGSNNSKPDDAHQKGSKEFNMLFDVPLRVTVELGRTRKTIEEILDLSTGDVIELDKKSGEPADMFVNGKLVARGEIVLIDENIGIRLTEIVKN